MTMSRIIALALLAFSSAANAAAPQTAEQAMENYRLTFKPLEPRDCAQPGKEIALCGKRDLPDQRLPPLDPVAGERIAGEPPIPLTGSGQRCSSVGPNQDCGGGLPLLGSGAGPAQTGRGPADRDH